MQMLHTVVNKSAVNVFKFQVGSLSSGPLLKWCLPAVASKINIAWLLFAFCGLYEVLNDVQQNVLLQYKISDIEVQTETEIIY